MVSRPLDQTATFDPAGGEGLVIVNVVERASSGATLFRGTVAFARYNPETLAITGASGIRTGVLFRDALMFMNEGFGTPQRFRAYKLPPGEYALLAAQRYVGREHQTTAYVQESPFVVRENTPVFSIKAGEMLYIGELGVNTGMFPARLQIGIDIPGLHQFLKSMPELKAEKIAIRPLESYTLVKNRAQ